MKKTPGKIFVLKPDGIGDFVLATGALRYLASEVGESRLVLAVLPAVAPLAAQQFPAAEILALPLRTKRQVLNLFLANFLRLFPLWTRLLTRRFDAVLSLRNSRPYLHSFLLASLRSPMLCLVENTFGQGGFKPRQGVEKALWALRRTRVTPYPKSAPSMPLEIEANRCVLSCYLNKEVPPGQITPLLRPSHHPPPTGNETPILLCPVSTDPAKDFPEHRWIELAADLTAHQVLHPAIPWMLTGSADQTVRLTALAQNLAKTGLRAITVATRQSLTSFVDLVAGARLLLTVDTAAAHIATALDRPSVIAFSGMHRGTYGPWQRSHRQRWLEADQTIPDAFTRRKSQWHQGISRAQILHATTALLLAET